MTATGHAQVRLGALAPLLVEARADGLHWMSDAEHNRMCAMRSEGRRHQFLAGHWLLRRLAGDILGGEPAQWLLGTGPDGAPRLQSPAHGAGRNVPASLSHGGDWVAAAIASFPLGIDLECPLKPRNLLAIADAVFCPEECAELLDLPDGDRAAAFYLNWTLKEALGKREGHGLRPELARLQYPRPCAASEADVVSWQFADCSLALAGEIGMSVTVTGLPDGASRRYWRIEAAAP